MGELGPGNSLVFDEGVELVDAADKAGAWAAFGSGVGILAHGGIEGRGSFFSSFISGGWFGLIVGYS